MFKIDVGKLLNVDAWFWVTYPIIRKKTLQNQNVKYLENLICLR